VWKRLNLIGILVAVFLVQQAAGAEGAAESVDTRLQRAEAFVARSDRYLPVDKLRRGMKGYGLTVMTGTEVERFDAAVISVLHNYWGPHQSVILCKLDGLGLDRSGVIEGMSGSPVFVADPADGKAKIIGAVAYTWSFQKEPICGVQPIAQMLAVKGVPLPGADGPADAPVPAGSAQAPAGGDVVRAYLNPAKLDFGRMAVPELLRPSASAGPGGPRLVPLSTPVMIAGPAGRTMSRAQKMFSGTGLVPVRTGALGQAEARAAAGAKLAPGMAVSIPLVTGDSDWAAVGTVTEVLGEYVLCFGHSFFGEGPIEMPMGPAYVHSVIPSVWSSFKLGSTLRVTGALIQDEFTAVGGQLGRKARMVPMTLTVRWPGSEQIFRYNLLRHRWLTAAIGSVLVSDSVYVNRNLPDHHTLDYTVEVEFERLGTYRVANRSSRSYDLAVSSDLTRPLAALMNTSLGQPAFPKRIDMTVTIRPEETTATILSLQLDRNRYKPGETVKGKVTLRPFRRERTTMDVSIELPDDMPDGQYALTACNAGAAVSALQDEKPHRFAPRTVEQLFEAVKDVVEPRADRLYLRLPLPEGGLAVGKQELKDVPGSLGEILARAAPIDAEPFREAKVVDFPSEYVLAGSAQAAFIVEKHPRREP